MMPLLARLAAWLSALANMLGALVLSPMAALPGWFSSTLIAALTGVLLLLVFKYTSDQRAIKRVRNSINANMLALRLFKESTAVTLKAQGRILWGALRLLVLALVPMAIMTIPVMLVLGQLSLWYQQRPLRIGEETVLTLTVNPERVSRSTPIALDSNGSVEVLAGPVHVASKAQWVWRLKAKTPGDHVLRINAGPTRIDKRLAIGGDEKFLRASPLRPGSHWLDILLYPLEPPFGPDSDARSVSVTYPDRPSWTHGTGSWVIYWFVVSMIAAIAFLKVFKVHV
jgi:uncharacterized membrane protein (DUF106 family)